MSQAGWRTAELHLALSIAPPASPISAPGPTAPEDVRGWIRDGRGQAERVSTPCAFIAKRSGLRSGPRRSRIGVRGTFPDRLAALLPADVDGLKIRLHATCVLRTC